MVNPSTSPAASSHEGATDVTHGQSVFTSRFSEDERRDLMSEDRSAQLGISAILATLIAIGMVLGIISVILVTYLGI